MHVGHSIQPRWACDDSGASSSFKSKTSSMSGCLHTTQKKRLELGICLSRALKSMRFLNEIIMKSRSMIGSILSFKGCTLFIHIYIYPFR